MLLSIIVPTFNQWEYTKLMLETLVAFPPQCDFDLIVVDNASTDMTIENIALDWKKKLPIQFIHNKENLGVAKAWNQGLKRAKGDKFLIINNDILFYPATIEEMLKIDEWAVVPRATSGEEDHQAYYEQHIRDNTPPHESVPLLLKGYCFLLDKSGLQEMYHTESVLNKTEPENEYGIALFDEQFEMAHYEDTDFDNRLRNAGHAPVEAQRAFIHHFGSRTLVPNLGTLMPFIEENARRYHAKYKTGQEE